MAASGRGASNAGDMMTAGLARVAQREASRAEVSVVSISSRLRREIWKRDKGICGIGGEPVAFDIAGCTSTTVAVVTNRLLLPLG